MWLFLQHVNQGVKTVSGSLARIVIGQEFAAASLSASMNSASVYLRPATSAAAKAARISVAVHHEKLETDLAYRKTFEGAQEQVVYLLRGGTRPAARHEARGTRDGRLAVDLRLTPVFVNRE